MYTPIARHVPNDEIYNLDGLAVFSIEVLLQSQGGYCTTHNIKLAKATEEYRGHFPDIYPPLRRK